jgi:pyridoxine kinase
MQKHSVLAMHDLSGYSHTSLMAIIPIMSKLGISVCALPTAVLSSNTEHKGFQLVDLTEHLVSFLEHWSKLKLSFSAIYSGFLCSERQVEIVIRAIELFKQSGQIVVVDPVMADDGKLYSCFDRRIVTAMQELINYADVITPNLTEAAFLLNMEYDDEIGIRKVKDWCKMLSRLGPSYVVITGVSVLYDTSKTAVVCYDRTINRYYVVKCEYQPVNYPGRGDIFTSVLTANLINGLEFPKAVRKAVSFVSKATKITMEMNLPEQEGICLEHTIGLLRK